MKLNGRMLFALLLLGLWLYWAWNAFSSGNVVLATIFLGAGVLITAWRLKAAAPDRRRARRHERRVSREGGRAVVVSPMSGPTRNPGAPGIGVA